MKKIVVLFGVLCMQCYCVAQAPVITYSGGPQTYFTGTAISPLAPTNSGGAVPASIYGQVSTFAGSGTPGANDGASETASFNYPKGVAIDASGNVYVCDQVNHKIRKISPSGVVTTFAGSGAQGSTNGIGTAASFYNPIGLALDVSGNVYIADYNNNKIRKITPAGLVTTFAGSGAAGSANGTGTAASFNSPLGVAVDAAGNVYVADQVNNKIRKITSAGVVTTLAGSGLQGATNATGAAASFYYPFNVTVDASGNVYVADSVNNKIRKITSAGVVSTLAGSGTAGSTDGTGTTASFNYPAGITSDTSGNIYVGDSDNHKIRKVSPAGVVTTLAGSTPGGEDGIGIAARFLSPCGLKIDNAGNMYITDSNHKIRKISISGYTISPGLPAGLSFDGTTGIVSGTPTVATAATTYTITAYNASGSSVTTVSIATVMLPNISYSGGAQTYVVGTAISPLTPNNTGSAIPASIYGQVTTFAGSGTIGTANGTGTAASFYRPRGVALDASGNMYVSDFYNNKIRKITPAGVVSNFAGSGTAGSTNATGVAASFYNPYGIAIDASGNIYVADNANNKIRKITAAGVVTTLAGSGTAGSANGTGIAASFNSPMGIALDAAGNVYVADYNNHIIRKITAAGVVTTFAGSGTFGSTDATGISASFTHPAGVAIDGSGNVYVADEFNHKIRKISAAGVVTTFAGNGSAGDVDGLGTAAGFVYPRGIATDTFGNVFVSSNYNRIRKIGPDGMVSSLAGISQSGSIDGVGTDASFNGTTGLTIDASGNLYVADSSNHKIRKVLSYGYGITPALAVGLKLDGATGIISGTPIVASPATTYTITGNNASGSGSTTINFATSLVAPSISYGVSTQTFVTGTAINSLIPTNSGGIVFSNGQVATSSASVYTPNGITTDALGNTYVAEEWNHRIIKISAAGIVSTFANFFRPHGLATDALGNVYAGSANNEQVRKISAAGVVTNIAYINSYNGGITVDVAGNIYVSAVYNIYKINPAGVVTIFAGSSTAGFADGIGTAASFGYPVGLATDSSGNIYVADPENKRIRKITAAGVVTTYAGNGTAGWADGANATSTFSYPQGVATDYSGNVYVSDFEVHKIRKIGVNGMVSTFAGSASNIPGAIDGIGSSARFYGVRNIATDLSGNVYVIGEDYKLRKIYIDGYDISPSIPSGLNFDGITGTISGTPTVATAATEYTITAYNAAGSSTTTVTLATILLMPPTISYIGGPYNYVIGAAISNLNPVNSGGPVSAYGQVHTIAGSGAAGSTDAIGTAAGFNLPCSVTPDGLGNIYVAEYAGNKIRKITEAGVVSTFAGSGTSGSLDGTGTSASFYSPTGVATDALGNLFVTDANNIKIRKITSGGAVTTFAGSGTLGSNDQFGTSASFNLPMGLALDSSGNIFIADNNNNKIRKITSLGLVTTFAGSGATGSTDAIGTAASFNSPRAIAIDGQGNMYVAEQSGNRIRKITVGGQVSTFAGSGTPGSSNGTGTGATFNAPSGLAVDSAGNIYVADTSNHKIRKITPSGVVTTLAGGTLAGSADGIGTTAGFSSPFGIAVDSSDNIYVADYNNHKIRKVSVYAYSISPVLPMGLSFDIVSGTISGSPTVVTAATQYTITAYNAAGSSSTTVTIATCSTLVTPTFTAVAPVCPGGSLSALPTTSNDSITGTWSPALNNSTSTTYTFTPSANECATTTTLTIVVLEPAQCHSILNLKLYIEGYYDTGTSTMRSVKLNQGTSASATEVETITLELHNAVNFGLVETSSANLQTDGTAVGTFSNTPHGSYYIVAKGRNFIASWSALPQPISTTPLNYDFTNLVSKAYGNNMIEVETGVWAFYTGDINQDEVIDGTDAPNLFNDVENSEFGNITTDLNGDGSVDNSDIPVFSNNADNSIFAVHP